MCFVILVALLTLLTRVRVILWVTEQTRRLTQPRFLSPNPRWKVDMLEPGPSFVLTGLVVMAMAAPGLLPRRQLTLPRHFVLPMPAMLFMSLDSFVALLQFVLVLDRSYA